MAKHLETGKWGEDLAYTVLDEHKYTILHRNWRFKRLEVDFIAVDQGTLVFVEVKTRNDYTYGCPSEAVGFAKQRTLARAAAIFLGGHPKYTEIRFDIITVIKNNENKKIAVDLIKDAFWPD